MPWSLLCISSFVDVFFLLLKEIKQQNKSQPSNNNEKNDLATHFDHRLLVERDLTRKFKEGVTFLQTLSKHAPVVLPDFLRLKGCYEVLVNANQTKSRKLWNEGYNLAKKMGMKYHQAKFLFLFGEYIDFPEISSELVTKKDVLLVAEDLFLLIGATEEATQCKILMDRVQCPVVVTK
jgi:hypothetical protein